ncbi:MAG: YitT family protein [Erysipelotrichales bacterium]|nr:YitT family protein [Erysipelotrichales bacterium]
MKNKFVRKYVNIVFGVFLVALGFTIFLVPHNLVIGGVSGLGIILGNFWDFNLALILLAVNILLLFIALIFMGKKFFLNTILGALLFPCFTFLINLSEIVYHLQVEDLLLSIISSSVIMGIGLGLALKEGANTGGTDVLQAVIFKYFHIPFSKSLYLIDGIVIVLGVIVFNDFQIGLYAIIFLIICGKVIDAVVFGGFNKRATYIISEAKDEIKTQIFRVLSRGVSEMPIKGGYQQESRTMLLCVLSTREYFVLRSIVEKIDPKAFLFVTKATEVRGLGFSFDEQILPIIENNKP